MDNNNFIFAGFWIRVIAGFIDNIIGIIAYLGIILTAAFMFTLVDKPNDKADRNNQQYIQNYLVTTKDESDMKKSKLLSKTSNIENNDQLYEIAIILLFYSFCLFYSIVEALFLSSHLQATPGKYLMSIYVINKDGSRLSFWKALFRSTIGRIISSTIFCLGYFWVAFDKEKRGFHDMISSTYVVVKQKKITN